MTHHFSCPKSGPGARSSSASGAAWIVAGGIWGCLLLHFDPSLFVLMSAAPHGWQAACVLIWIGCLNAFWLFASYYLVMGIVAARISRTAPDSVPPENRDAFAGVRVAILYPTRNDFREANVESLLRLDWPDCSVFICDDSTLESYHSRIDAFARAAREEQAPLRVIRRPRAGGWKAGNLNFALSQLSEDFDYFAVCDCDGVFPSNLIRDCLPFFAENPVPEEPLSEQESGSVPGSRCAFVQCRQEANPAQPEPFGRIMAPPVGAHFRHCVAARARFGFVMFYGHGALISMRAWKVAGGFSEIVTEDLAFSLRLRGMGWHGVYAPNVVCLEDYPPTFAHLRKRTDKWIRGTGECLLKFFGPFWRSRHVPLAEKLDVLIHAATHFMAAPMLIFLALLAVVLPAALAEFRVPGGFFIPAVPDGKSLVERALTAHYHVFWSWDFFAVMLLTTVAGWLPFFYSAPERGRHTFAEKMRYFGVSTWVCLASLVTEFASIVAFAVTRRATFSATYDSAPADTPPRVRGAKRPPRGARPSPAPSHPVILGLELAAGLGFAAALACWRNLWFAGPAIALVSSPILLHNCFRSRRALALASIPCIFVMLLFGLVAWNLARR